MSHFNSVEELFLGFDIVRKMKIFTGIDNKCKRKGRGFIPQKMTIQAEGSCPPFFFAKSLFVKSSVHGIN